MDINSISDIKRVTNEDILNLSQIAAAKIKEMDSLLENGTITKEEYTERAASIEKEVVEQFFVSRMLEAAQKFEENVRPLTPYLEQELKAQQDAGNEAYKGWDIIRVLSCLSFTGEIEDERARQIVEGAKKREAAPSFKLNQSDKVKYPLDKPNNIIWNMLQKADRNGQLEIDTSGTMNIRTNKRGDTHPVYVMFGLDFNDLDPNIKITKQLTPFDKRVQIACAAIWNDGNPVTTLTQIHYKMGNTKTPNKSRLQKIADSLAKQRIAQIIIDNYYEAQTYQEFTRFKYEGALLPSEIISAYINDVFTDGAVHFFREPPMITFSRERKQITAITQKLLETPGNKTDATLRLEDYLIDRIGHMKNQKTETAHKILFSTIFDSCHLTTDKQKMRAPAKIKRILDHFVSCEWIQGYSGIDGSGKPTTNGVTIDL